MTIRVSMNISSDANHREILCLYPKMMRMATLKLANVSFQHVRLVFYGLHGALSFFLCDPSCFSVDKSLTISQFAANALINILRLLSFGKKGVTINVFFHKVLSNQTCSKQEFKFLIDVCISQMFIDILKKRPVFYL